MEGDFSVTTSSLITVNGSLFTARRGELLLDAALRNGVDLPYNCRAGHCGTCCIRVTAGSVTGGDGAEPGIVHACQARIAGDATFDSGQPSGVRSVNGVLRSLRPLSAEVVELGITTDNALPYLAGQYAQVRFKGFPSRPFSITHPMMKDQDNSKVWFHVRRMPHAGVTASLGRSIMPGHRVVLSGPYGQAYFRPNLDSQFILVATNTGFAPIWSIAVAALRENPERMLMIIAGGRTLQSLYMGAALQQLARFRNVCVVPVCSTPQTLTNAVITGRPTDFLPQLIPSDVIYACGAPAMVASIKAIAAHSGAICYADPFMLAARDAPTPGALARTRQWLAAPKIRTEPHFTLNPSSHPPSLPRSPSLRA